MASITKWRLLVICVIGLTLKVEVVRSSAEVMKKMTVGFSKVLEACKQELNLGDNVLQDFFNFWKEDYQLLNREMGCAIICMASKFDLISADSNKMHHINAQEFAKKHGADDDTTKQLITIIHECEKTHEGVTDDCTRILEVSKCFRAKIHGLKWAPDMETILEEIMAEVRS